VAPELPWRRLNLWIIGPGRVGLSLATALRQAGALEFLTVTGRRAAPPDHPLFRGTAPSASYRNDLAPPDPAPDCVLLAVPDAAIVTVAEGLRTSSLPLGVPMLHTSGALGSEVMAGGHADLPLGSLHPLLAIADAQAGAALLRGGWFALEGDASAVSMGRRIVEHLGGREIPVAPEMKPVYHAAAVFASNYLVALLDTAERLAVEAGAPPEVARAALCELSRSAVAAVEGRGPLEALTGPVSRGDAATVRLHLERLSGPDAALYSVLAQATLEVARRRGLGPEPVREIQRLLSRTL
jgi:predicted short-subunit dehydrogenase-like oxidoreductase (DUF2520 family)